ncbi:hypothetical protein LTR66_006424 [Elasticomyces elasticus]|nr:hypothetical protein LTR66_006424 [Elasticomyces elasticus]
MSESIQETSSQTLALLELRLRRIQYILHGDTLPHEVTPPDFDANPTIPISTRIQNLERSLQSLTSHSRAVSQLLQLESKHPELFHPIPPTTVPSTLPIPSLAALILAHSPLYPQTASQLSSLADLSIPDPSSSAALIALLPRLQKVEAKQRAQDDEIAMLRARSAEASKRWYELSVLGQGECWSEWEGRLARVERDVWREEGRRRREEGLV